MIVAALAAAAIASSIKGKGKKKKAARIQREIQALQSDRQRKLALKEYRLARSQAISQISASGAEDSSALHGIKGSLTSQIQSNLEHSFQEEHMTSRVGAALDRASNLDFLSGALSMGAGIASGAQSLRQVSTGPTQAVVAPPTKTPSTSGPATGSVTTYPLPQINVSPFVPLGQ